MGLGFDPFLDDPWWYGTTAGVTTRSGGVQSGPFGTGPGYRKKKNSGLYEMQVNDPNNPIRLIWVDAFWDPTLDRLIPLDAQYRAPGDRDRLWKVLSNQFAPSDSGGNAGPVEDTYYVAGGLPPAAQPVTAGGGSGLLLAVVAVIGLYALTR